MGRKLGVSSDTGSTEIKNTGSLGQMSVCIPIELFKPDIIIVKRSFGSLSIAGLLKKANAEYLRKHYKDKEILEMIEAYDKLKEKPKHWY